MTQLKLIQERPNPQAITFVLEKDIMGDLSKVSIPRSDAALTQYSPLAQMIYQLSKSTTRVDFFLDAEKHTRITLSRALMPWEPKHIEITTKLLSDFEKTGQQYLLPEALMQNMKTTKAYKPEGPIQKLIANVFQQQVNPRLAQDGGTMELTNVELNNDGTVYADVVLAGACGGCSMSGTHTLKNATISINQAINQNKALYPDNAALQSLAFKEIRAEKVDRLILAR